MSVQDYILSNNHHHHNHPIYFPIVTQKHNQSQINQYIRKAAREAQNSLSGRLCKQTACIRGIRDNKAAVQVQYGTIPPLNVGHIAIDIT